MVHFPHNMCPAYVMEELAYWEIPDYYLAKCCWFWLKAHQMEYEVRDRIEATLTDHLHHKKSWRIGSWKEKVYLFLEYPRSSKFSKVMMVVMIPYFVIYFQMLVFLTVLYQIFNKTHIHVINIPILPEAFLTFASKSCWPLLLSQALYHSLVVFVSIFLVKTVTTVVLKNVLKPRTPRTPRTCTNLKRPPLPGGA